MVKEKLKAKIVLLYWYTDPEDEAVTQEMQRLMSKVDEMQKQREMLVQQLRKQVHDDDVTTALVTREDGNMDVSHHFIFLVLLKACLEFVACVEY